MTTKTDYPYIRAWGRYMGSGDGFIQHKVKKARSMEAPQNAIYERDGRWYTTDQITNPRTRTALDLPPLPDQPYRNADRSLSSAAGALYESFSELPSEETELLRRAEGIRGMVEQLREDCQARFVVPAE